MDPVTERGRASSGKRDSEEGTQPFWIYAAMPQGLTLGEGQVGASEVDSWREKCGPGERGILDRGVEGSCNSALVTIGSDGRLSCVDW